jgi:diguanylate cyclase (GGDEF)-like protein
MTTPEEQEFVVREPWAMDATDGMARGIQHKRPAKVVPHRRDRIGDGLARRVLAHLPLAVAVIDPDAVLLFWNEQASLLFGAAPLMAAERPTLGQMLGRIGTMTRSQRDRVVAFVAAHVAAGDRSGPDGCLRLSLGRAWRIAIEVHGLGAGRWMLVFDDGKVTAAGNPAAYGMGDAWLDSLTGVSNRRHFDDMLREAVAHATADTRQAVMLIDLDGFAPVNESFGHPVGDALLCLVAQRLRREIRDDDLLARLGGDEFALLLPNGEAESLAVRVIATLAQPFLVEGQRVTIGASAGIARFPDHGTSADDLMRHAYLALYQAKNAGGRICRVFDAAMAREAEARREMETDLRKALALGEISLTYRPCGDIPSHVLTGFEGRIRWDHPGRGVVAEADFMPLAESDGLIVALGEWALKTACVDAAGWPAQVGVAMRVSSRQLQDADQLVEAVQQGLGTSGLVPARLELKIPETALVGREDEVLPTLRRLRALGVGIGLVDFAIGPSLLDRLRWFPFRGISFDGDNLFDVAADADKASVLCALSVAGFDRIGCYFGDLLTSTSGIAEVVRLHTASGDPASTAE